MGSSSKSSTTSDFVDDSVVSFSVISILALGKMWMDIFILAVTCRAWMKKKSLSLIDKILALQGSLRICHACVGMLWCILDKFSPWIIQRVHFFKMLTFSIWYFIIWNLWVTASLSSYYCVKIADFRHPFFVGMKLRLSRLVSIWLVGSVVLSLASSLPYICSDLEIRDNWDRSNFFGNKSITNLYEKRMPSHVVILLALGCLAAFLICSVSAILLLFSLWRHRQRMLGSWDGHRSPQTDAHFQALIIILLRLINHVVISVSVLLFLRSSVDGNGTVNVASAAVIYSCFSVESLISLWGNKKLKNELCRALHFATCRGHAA